MSTERIVACSESDLDQCLSVFQVLGDFGPSSDIGCPSSSLVSLARLVGLPQDAQHSPNMVVIFLMKLSHPR